MAVEQTFRNHVATAISPVPIYANRAPDGQDGTYVVQRVISKQDADYGTTTTRFQFDIFGDTYAAVKTVAVAVEGAFRTYSGSDTFSVIRGNEIETYESAVNKHRVILDAMVRFDERKIFG